MRQFMKKLKLNRDDDTFTFRMTPLPGGDDFGFLMTKALRSISGSTNIVPDEALDYAELIGDKEINPKLIRRIRIICDNIDQFSYPFIWYFTDSNGQQYTVQDQPLNMLSPMQFQSRVLDIPYKRLIVGNNEGFQWFVPTPTTIKLTFEYDDYRLENLLEDDRKLVR